MRHRLSRLAAQLKIAMARKQIIRRRRGESRNVAISTAAGVAWHQSAGESAAWRHERWRRQLKTTSETGMLAAWRMAKAQNLMAAAYLRRRL